MRLGRIKEKLGDSSLRAQPELWRLNLTSRSPMQSQGCSKGSPVPSTLVATCVSIPAHSFGLSMGLRTTEKHPV